MYCENKNIDTFKHIRAQRLITQEFSISPLNSYQLEKHNSDVCIYI